MLTLDHYARIRRAYRDGNRVKNLQRRWATPVQRIKDLAEMNHYLRRCCLQDRDRVVSSKDGTIGQRFEAERAAALPLPSRSFDACNPPKCSGENLSVSHNPTKTHRKSSFHDMLLS